MTEETVLSHEESLNYFAYRYLCDLNRVVCLLWQNSKDVAATGMKEPACLNSSSDDFEVWNGSWVATRVGESEQPFNSSCMFHIHSDGSVKVKERPDVKPISLSRDNGLMGLAVEIVSELIGKYEWDHKETVSMIADSVCNRPWRFQRDHQREIWFDNWSKESMEVMQYFGQEAPHLLNEYCCALEDAFLEQIEKGKALTKELAESKGEVPDLESILQSVQKVQAIKPPAAVNE